MYIYNMEIVHRPGNDDGNADGLSRIPDEVRPCTCYTVWANLEELPCGGCQYCTRAQERWSRFEDDVDDVVPLAVKRVVLDPEDDRPWVDKYDVKEMRSEQMADEDVGPYCDG